MYETIKLGNKWGWYMHDDEGNTTKEGTELFATQDEAQEFLDVKIGKNDNTVEVLSDPMYHIIKIGNRFGWYLSNENGDTVKEGSEFFARHSQVQSFLNGNFPVDSGVGSKSAETVAPAPTATTAPAADVTTAPVAPTNVLGEWPADTVYPYAFTEADIQKYTVLWDNGVRAGDEVDSQENLVLALTPKA